MKKLVIAEKPSVAQTIAKALGVSGKGDGCIEGDEYVVTWCYGHMLEIKDDPKYSKWRLEDLPIIPEKWQYEPIESSKDQLARIRKLIERRDIGSIVCATDAGREGELIFRLVYNDSRTKKPAERLWVSSLEESSVREGFSDLRPSSDYDSLYAAALGRSEADWLVGINATRFYSVVFQSPDGKPLTVGRVQTPTLQMIIDRENEIASFETKESFLVAKIFDGWTLQSTKYDTEDEAKGIMALTDGKAVTIKNIEEKDRKQSPPLLYSLTSLQRDANRQYGYSADKTLQLAQDLYEKKMLSYPRTDAEYLTSDMEKTFSQVVRMIAPSFYPDLRFENVKRLIDDSKVSDHYALMLTKHFADTISKTGTDGFTRDEANIIKLVAKRMLQSVSPWHQWHETKVTGESEGVEFTGTGRKEIDLGFLEIGRKKETETYAPVKGSDKKDDDDAGVFPPDMKAGAVYMPLSSEIRKRKTNPPKPYTEDTLLGAMEKAGSKDMPDDAERKGLGTSATRAGIIEGLVKKGYVVREKRKKGADYLRPTDKARYLVSIVEPSLKDAKMTAEWEWRLKSIEKGKDTLPTFIGDIEKSVRKIIEEGLDSTEAKEAEERKREGIYIGLCPFCSSPVISRGKLAECTGPECRTKVWKENRRLNGHTLTDDELRKLFNGEYVVMSLHSERTGKNYKAAVTLADTPYVYTDKNGNEVKTYSFDLSFDQAKTGYRKKKGNGNWKGNRSGH